MFTPEERARLRSELLTRVSADGRISGAAITGSGAAEREDRWSDIDLTFGVGEGAEMPDVLSDWTTRMYARHGAVHHVDMKAGAWIYRVFLLASTLQVDLAFVPAAEFRALAATFRLVFGKAEEPRQFPPPLPADIIGMSWLYALHARSCIARRKLWQAEYMISAVRDHALTLACLRHGLSGGLWPRIRSTAGCGHGRIPRLFRGATRCKGADSCLPDGYGRAAPGNPAQ